MSKILFWLTPIKHHSIVQYELMKELGKRGHEVIEEHWEYGKQCAPKAEADLYITDHGIPSKTIDAPNRLWMSCSHGVSPYKNWATQPSFVNARLTHRIVPTELWATDYNATEGRINPDLKMPVANGWSKLDLYHRMMADKSGFSKKIYERYNIDPKKPTIVFTPTGIVLNSGTKNAWLNNEETKGRSLEAYRRHGTLYLLENLEKAIKKLNVNFVCLQHPTNNRDDDPYDRIRLLTMSDMLISDTSSMSLEYTVLNKPIILLRKPAPDFLVSDFHLFQSDFSTTVDLGDIVTAEHIPATIKERLKNDVFSLTRNRWSSLLLGICDGHCSEREADIVEQVLKERT